MCQWLSPGLSVSYLYKTWPSFPSNSCSERIHYSLALVASMSLKIKLTHSASLLCRCNYKSSLSLCEQGKRSQQPSEGVAEGLADDEVSLEREKRLGPPPGIRIAQATGESIWCQFSSTVQTSCNGREWKYKIQLLLPAEKGQQPAKNNGKVRLGFPQVPPFQ